MDLQPTVRESPVIVAIPGWLNVSNAGQVCQRLSVAVAAGAGHVIADLSATTFMDAAGAHRLVMVSHQAAARGGELRLVIPPGALLRWVLVLLEVDHLLPVYSSIQEALGPPAGRRHPLTVLRG